MGATNGSDIHDVPTQVGPWELVDERATKIVWRRPLDETDLDPDDGQEKQLFEWVVVSKVLEGGAWRAVIRKGFADTPMVDRPELDRIEQASATEQGLDMVIDAAIAFMEERGGEDTEEQPSEDEIIAEVMAEQDAETVERWRRVDADTEIPDVDADVLVQWRDPDDTIAVYVAREERDDEPRYPARAVSVDEDAIFSKTTIATFPESLETSLDRAIQWLRRHRPGVPFPQFSMRIDNGIFNPLIDLLRRFGGRNTLIEVRDDALVFRSSSHVNTVDFRIPLSDMESFEVDREGEFTVETGTLWDGVKNKNFSTVIPVSLDADRERPRLSVADESTFVSESVEYNRRSTPPIDPRLAQFTIDGLEYKDKTLAAKPIDSETAVFGRKDGIVLLHIEDDETGEEVTARFETTSAEGEQLVLVNPERLQNLRKAMPRPSQTPITFTIGEIPLMLAEYTVGETDTDVRIALKTGPVPREIDVPPAEIQVPEDTGGDVVDEFAREAAAEAQAGGEAPVPVQDLEETLTTAEDILEEATEAGVGGAGVGGVDRLLRLRGLVRDARIAVSAEDVEEAAALQPQLADAIQPARDAIRNQTGPESLLAEDPHRNTEVDDLPGIGRTTRERFAEIQTSIVENIATIAHLVAAPTEDLSEENIRRKRRQLLEMGDALPSERALESLITAVEQAAVMKGFDEVATDLFRQGFEEGADAALDRQDDAQADEEPAMEDLTTVTVKVTPSRADFSRGEPKLLLDPDDIPDHAKQAIRRAVRNQFSESELDAVSVQGGGPAVARAFVEDDGTIHNIIFEELSRMDEAESEPDQETADETPPPPPEEQPEEERSEIIVARIGGTLNYIVQGAVPGAVEDEAVSAAIDTLGQPGQFDNGDTVGTVSRRGTEITSIGFGPGRAHLAGREPPGVDADDTEAEPPAEDEAAEPEPAPEEAPESEEPEEPPTEIAQLSQGQIETIVEQATVGIDAKAQVIGSVLREIKLRPQDDPDVFFTTDADLITAIATDGTPDTIRKAIRRWAEFTDFDSLTDEQVEEINTRRMALEDQFDVQIPLLEVGGAAPELAMGLSQDDVDDIVRRSTAGVIVEVVVNPDANSLRIQLSEDPGSSVEFTGSLREVQGVPADPVGVINEALSEWEDAVDMRTVPMLEVTRGRERIEEEFDIDLLELGDEPPEETEEQGESPDLGLEGVWKEIREIALDQSIPKEDREFRIAERLEPRLFEEYPEEFSDLIVGIIFPDRQSSEDLVESLDLKIGGSLTSDGHDRFVLPRVGTSIAGIDGVKDPEAVWNRFMELLDIFDPQSERFAALTDKLETINSTSTFRIEEGLVDDWDDIFLAPDEAREIVRRNPDLWENVILAYMKDESSAWWAAQRVKECAEGAEVVCDFIERSISGRTSRGTADWYLDQAYRLFLDGDFDPVRFVQEFHNVFEPGETEAEARERRGAVDLDTLGRVGEPRQRGPEPEAAPQAEAEGEPVVEGPPTEDVADRPTETVDGEPVEQVEAAIEQAAPGVDATVEEVDGEVRITIAESPGPVEFVQEMPITRTSADLSTAITRILSAWELGVDMRTIPFDDIEARRRDAREMVDVTIPRFPQTDTRVSRNITITAPVEGRGEKHISIGAESIIPGDVLEATFEEIRSRLGTDTIQTLFDATPRGSGNVIGEVVWERDEIEEISLDRDKIDDLVEAAEPSEPEPTVVEEAPDRLDERRQAELGWATAALERANRLINEAEVGDAPQPIIDRMEDARDEFAERMSAFRDLPASALSADRIDEFEAAQEAFEDRMDALVDQAEAEPIEVPSAEPEPTEPTVPTETVTVQVDEQNGRDYVATNDVPMAVQDAIEAAARDVLGPSWRFTGGDVVGEVTVRGDEIVEADFSEGRRILRIIGAEDVEEATDERAIAEIRDEIRGRMEEMGER